MTATVSSSTGTTSCELRPVRGRQTDPLPKKNIDTGMGLERMASIPAGVESVYDTDLFRPLIELAEEKSGFEVRRRRGRYKAMRVISDHSAA